MTSPSPPERAAGNPESSRGFRRSLSTLRAVAVVVILLMPAVAALHAATVDVVVRAPNGLPARGVQVFLHPPLARPEPDLRALLLALREVRTFRGQTDRRGAVRFVGLPRGRYTVSLLPLPGTIVQPAANPDRPAPVVTVFEDDEQLGLEVRLEHGVPVTVELEAPGSIATTQRAPGGEPLPFQARFRHHPSDLAFTADFDPLSASLQRLLVPGVWEVSLTAPPGYVLRELTQDRLRLDGHRVTLELGPSHPPVYLSWTFEAPATLQGTVDVLGGPPQAVSMIALLVEAGEWLAAADARGGSRYREVAVPVEPSGRYRFDLPAGVWRVVPFSERLLASDPQAHTVELEEGEIAEADFELELEEREVGSFRVQVVDPRRENLRGAAVELRPLYFPTDAVMASGLTESFGVELPLVPEDDYLLVAGHPDYLEARRELSDFRSAEVPYQSIELERGAAFRLRAVDLDGRVAAGVEWEIERLGPPLEVLLQDPAFLEAKRRRAVRSDSGGRAWPTGFYPGTYRVRAGIPSRGGPGALFHVGPPRQPALREAEIEVISGYDVELVARQQPAAHLELELLCADERRAPPPTASAVVVDLDAPVATADEAWQRAVLVLDEVPLLDGGRLIVGPLEQGVYRLAVRPAGFSRWTWAFGAATPSAAYPLQLDLDERQGDERIDLGSMHLECAPAVDIVPIYGDGPGPAARDLDLHFELVDPASGRLLACPAATPRDDRFALRGLPAGAARVEIVLRHPHFLPRRELRWRLDVELERGRFVEITPRIEVLGGAVRIEASGALRRGDFLRLAAPDRTLDGEGGEVDAVPPGVYQALLCGDPSCDPPLAHWPEIEVRRRRTVTLDTSALDSVILDSTRAVATPGPGSRN